MEISKLYKNFLESKGISTDTRTLHAGEMFFALSGPNFNGNKFALKALKLGAKYVIIDDPKYANSDKSILVPNTLQALQKLASFHRARLVNTKIIALTGSNGKTTTKELIHSVLKTQFNTYCTKGNLNNHIGVPLTLLRCEANVQYLVLEMGANHQGEISTLSNIANPDYGLITNIGKAHLEGFGGIEGVKKGKSELYKFLSIHNKSIFIDKDDETLGSILPKSSNVIAYKSSDFQIQSSIPFLELKYKNEVITSKLTGNFNLKNIAAAVKIGEFFNVASKNIHYAIENYIPTNNRSEILNLSNNKIFLDAYNANPSSMNLSLQNFINSNTAQESVIIIGDMLELGDYSFSEHKIILDSLVQFKGEVIAVGQEFYKHNDNYPKYKFYKTFDDLASNFKIGSYQNKHIFIKGSRGLALERIISN